VSSIASTGQASCALGRLCMGTPIWMSKGRATMAAIQAALHAAS
jgi:hypothetical protein